MAGHALSARVPTLSPACQSVSCQYLPLAECSWKSPDRRSENRSWPEAALPHSRAKPGGWIRGQKASDQYSIQQRHTTCMLCARTVLNMGGAAWNTTQRGHNLGEKKRASVQQTEAPTPGRLPGAHLVPLCKSEKNVPPRGQQPLGHTPWQAAAANCMLLGRKLFPQLGLEVRFLQQEPSA